MDASPLPRKKIVSRFRSKGAFSCSLIVGFANFFHTHVNYFNSLFAMLQDIFLNFLLSHHSPPTPPAISFLMVCFTPKGRVPKVKKL